MPRQPIDKTRKNTRKTEFANASVWGPYSKPNTPKKNIKKLTVRSKQTNKDFRDFAKNPDFAKDNSGRNMETRSGRAVSNAKLSAADSSKSKISVGTKKGYNTVKSGSNSISPRKTSVPVKNVTVKRGTANKLRAQGSKSMSTPTMGYNKLGNRKK